MDKQSMKTKEEILRQNANVPKPQIPGVLEAMEEYKNQFTPQSDKPEPVEQEMPDVIKFLLGEGELNGKAPFWWRTELRKLYTLTKK
jgi:hypothetical protein